MSTYHMQGNCNNCGYTGKIEVPKGKLASAYAKDAPCPNCDVKGTLSLDKYSDESDALIKAFDKFRKKNPNRIIPMAPQPYRIPYGDYPPGTFIWNDIPRRWSDSPELTCNVSTPEDLKDCQTYNHLDK